MQNHIQIAYIGGGSRQWARHLMSDLALDPHLSGDVRLFDIDFEAAVDNAKIGALYQRHPKAQSRFSYIACKTIEEALSGADIVIISILPGTFEDMDTYVHMPEAYGIFQSVGDTTGPAGIMRSLIAIPMFVHFGQMIRTYAPEAWVINFTNPMTICLQALHEGYPGIKAYGNCHEVFGSQEDLRDIFLEFDDSTPVSRDDIRINVTGINHFTWITQATCRGMDLMPLYHAHVQQYKKLSIQTPRGKYMSNNPFGSDSKIKFHLYDTYGVMAAAGDRHLAEFMPLSYYLDSHETHQKYRFHLTPISYRIIQRNKAIEKTKYLIEKDEPIEAYPSGEEALRQIKALLGYETFVTNINHINVGQGTGLPLNQVIETNALFSYQSITPIQTDELPLPVKHLICRHMDNHDLIMEAYRKKDLNYAVHAMSQDPLTCHLDFATIKQLFDGMKSKLLKYLNHYID